MHLNQDLVNIIVTAALLSGSTVNATPINPIDPLLSIHQGFPISRRNTIDNIICETDIFTQTSHQVNSKVNSFIVG
jgi:hypothetical protein